MIKKNLFDLKIKLKTNILSAYTSLNELLESQYLTFFKVVGFFSNVSALDSAEFGCFILRKSPNAFNLTGTVRSQVGYRADFPQHDFLSVPICLCEVTCSSAAAQLQRMNTLSSGPPHKVNSRWNGSDWNEFNSYSFLCFPPKYKDKITFKNIFWLICSDV